MQSWFRTAQLSNVLAALVVGGILLGIVFVNVLVFGQGGHDATRVADIRAIQRALSVYFDHTHSFPTSLSLLAPTYLAVVPTDPSGAAYFYSAFATSTKACQVGHASGYHLGAALQGHEAIAGNADAPAEPPVGMVLCAVGSSSPGFNGASDKCSGGAYPEGGDNCYDVVNE